VADLVGLVFQYVVLRAQILDPALLPLDRLVQVRARERDGEAVAAAARGRRA